MTRCSARRITHRRSDVQPDGHICDSYREFECGYCGREIRICRCCDDGQVYCPDDECAARVRELKVPGYRANYRRTHKGKKAHARRQMRYRDRQELALIVGSQVVTDHPSTFSSSSSTEPDIEAEEIEDDAPRAQPTSTVSEHRAPPAPPSSTLPRVIAFEEAERTKRSLQRRLKNARLGSFKSMADFDWSWPRKLDRATVEDLFAFGFVPDGTNILLMGPNGLGKTMITKNIPWEGWGDYLDDHLGATALLDRLLHQSHVIVINGPSWRDHEHQQQICRRTKKK